METVAGCTHMGHSVLLIILITTMAAIIGALIYLLHSDRCRVRELCAQQQQMRELTIRDPLTNMLNKIATHKEIDRILQEDPDKVHAFLIIDLDYFKRINDTYGHCAGDNVLTEAAAGLRGMFRKGGILGRIGGDEMVVFCRDIKTAQCASRRAGEVCELFRTFSGAEQTLRNVSCSIGVAMAPGDGSCFNQLYINADLALYTAKAEGRNRYELYDPSMDVDPQAQQPE